jgi:hypothetical protein
MAEQRETIGEQEAASLAGVSSQTLSRFAEAGYLTSIKSGSGELRFSKSELRDVFGITGEPVQRGDKLEDQVERGSTAALSSTSATPCSTTFDREHGTSNSEAPAEQPEQIVDSSLHEEQSVAPSVTAPQPLSADAAPLQTHNSAQQNNEELTSREVFKLKNVITLQERLLDAREAEIRELKEERSWLRSRIDRLDEKSDRDQLLLLSETQVIKKLVAQQNTTKNRSPVRAALEWLGVASSSNQDVHANTQNMIELDSRKSDQ